ncbi:MAG TPA: lipid-binding SYLF domain-containing protein [Vicinamibacterales bacterium]|jgi:lipid-binding SYLF domain-containing protein|nr:lipid-binding SYLF domain-containing protein [Vicinamibacterales bacterium]
MQTMRTLVASVAALLMSATAFGQLKQSDIEKLNEATGVLGELRNTAEGGIPDSLFSKAHCVVVIPDLKKAGFILGGEHGSGVMSCRRGNTWSPPVFMDLTKGSAGLQIGVQSTDLVLLVMNQSGADKLLRNKVTLGGDASVAAGPVGRAASAGTDAQLSAEMLSYSRTKGLFAGVDLSGGSLNPDHSKNERAYGPNASARDIALGTAHVKVSAEAQAFINALGRDTRGTSGKK